MTGNLEPDEVCAKRRGALPRGPAAARDVLDPQGTGTHSCRFAAAFPVVAGLCPARSDGVELGGNALRPTALSGGGA